MWYLYKDKIYNIQDYSDVVGELRTEAVYIFPRTPIFREYIRGCSGITQYGQHYEKKSKAFINDVIHGGVQIPEGTIQKRLRYSEMDGGKHFDSYREEFHNYLRKLKKKIAYIWKG